MRNLTTLCCLAATLGTSFWACQKNESIENFPSSFQPNAYSEPNKVFEQTSQSFDFQHLKSTHNLNEAIHPKPTPLSESAARFVLTYFSLFEGEKEKTYTVSSFQKDLIESGLSEKEACRRTDRIFKTMDCSPLYLTETARLLSPILPPHTEGAFICTLYKPFEADAQETFTERNLKNNDEKVLFRKNNAQERVKEVHKLVGVSGSIAAYGDSHIVFQFNCESMDSRTSCSVRYQDVRLVLQDIHGYTEGESIYVKLILGELTEQEVWLLFETGIIAGLQKADKIVLDRTNNPQLARLAFRYNYVEITGQTGRLGYTVYDLDGFTE